jgi:hypothetical protein
MRALAPEGMFFGLFDFNHRPIGQGRIAAEKKPRHRMKLAISEQSGLF